MTAARFGRLGEGPRPAAGEESVTDLLAAGGAVVERILSRAAASPPGFWYDQPRDEFVLLVSGGAGLEFPDGAAMRLAPGDYAILPAHCRHRVAWTEAETLWLAVHLPEQGAARAGG